MRQFSFIGILAMAVSGNCFGELYAEPSVPIPSSMAVLGDSVSEGMLAGFSLEKRPTMAQLAQLYWISTENDPIKRRDEYRKNFARKDMSWATGDNSRDLVLSHYERLKELNPDIVAYNFAISGQESFALNEEIELLNQIEMERGAGIDYLLIMIGANDLAAETSLDITAPGAFVRNVENGVRELLDRDPNRSLYFVGLPEIHEVFETSLDYVVYDLWGDDIKCRGMRKQIYGPKTIFLPENDIEYAYTKDVLREYRLGLESMALRLGYEFPEARIKYIRSVGKPMNVRKALSIDCFHPSEWGQAELAEITWNAGFWPQVQSDEWTIWQSSGQSSHE